MNTQHYISSSSKVQGKSSASVTRSSLCLIFLGLAIASTSASAQNQPQSPGDQYQVERADCYNGRSSEDGPTCLKDANAALEENRKDKLSVSGASYQNNSALRCQALPAAGKVNCEMRVRNERAVSGSVDSDGFLRELVVQSTVAAK